MRNIEMLEPSLKAAPAHLPYRVGVVKRLSQFPQRLKVWRNSFPVQTEIQVSFSVVSLSLFNLFPFSTSIMRLAVSVATDFLSFKV